MSHQVEQSALIQKESSQSDEGAIKAMKTLQETKEEKKPDLVIKGADLNLVMDATHLSRNEAIELIESTDGNIKEALCRYVTK
ncbi:hypothetical protein TRFO_35048 [Tritrichomonas foetus]|uniref:Nascent polypeptide-associated complex subunit alpha-like UBA domain-containing protein n=1 Tax=Tritrichomonas foetus TaxID=1144522 RepID=A0A1J4JHA7_9EUKA|nr:hypothetical protein TRFO_35048 [Tritrichomonas foetus]|eukprot:OHS98518.1 hypothetical protein TRFO_35048 [Tritrichomonas foetus]